MLGEQSQQRRWIEATGAIRRVLSALVTGALVLASALVPVVIAPLVLPGLAGAANAADDPCGPAGNKITCENSKPGTPRSQWDDFWGAGADSIQGYATEISTNVGGRVDFKIDTDARSYTIQILRIGYYGGDGARQVATVTPSAALPQNQPACVTDASTELYDCGNWGVSASWNVPASAVSGVYIARLHRADTDESSHITFVVRDESSTSDVLFQTSDPTWVAYNDYGGSNFYHGGANGRAYKLSYNRPMATRGGPGGRDFFMSNEYPMVRFLERNGYDVSYLSGVDTDRRGGLLRNHDVFLSVGHDEYWSGAQRANVEAARDAGVNLMFLSGNEVYWRTRYEPSADAGRTPYRTLVTYKETWDYDKSDPATEWTGTWRDPRFAPISTGAGRPENALTGTAYMVNHDDLPVTVNSDEGKLRLWRHTGLDAIPAGQSRALAPHTVGYESNEDVDNGHRPAGLVRLSTTTGPTPEYLQDFGNTVAPGSTTHHLTMYRAASGALVFSAGSVQWTWGLDEQHDSAFAPEPADARMQQAQVNLFADMGVQPATLMTGLTRATRTTDTTAPTVAISSPAAGSAQANGSRVTVTGTATDTGGRVAGVEVSTDGGTSWHAAEGRAQWSYSYVQHGVGSTPVRVRAMDDSANIGTAATRAFNVACPCSVYGAEVPRQPAADDASAAELGMRFTALGDGFVSGVRFYKGTGNGGTHTGSLWSTGGQRLATATFTGESAAGWQTVDFATPVAVTAGQELIVSYTAPQGRYAMQSYAFSAAGIDADPLRVDGGYGATPAGVYGNAGAFPDRSHRNTSYYVDPVFTTTDTSPLIATNQWPVPDSSSVPASTVVSARFSKAVTGAALELRDANGVRVAGSTSYDAASRTVTFTPDQPLAGFVRHTATVSGQDALGGPVTTGRTWSFTTAKPPAQPGVCPCSLFDESTLPGVLEVPDQNAVTLGVRFTADVNGTVTAVRFYKGAGNTGAHTGTLWSADGTVLAQGTFTGESSSGWQQLDLAQPVAITKDTPYVVSYRAPNGRYSATLLDFSQNDRSRPPLHVTANAGAYTYGTGFPSSTTSTNYLVDVVFEKAAPTVTITGRSPADGATWVPRGSTVRVDLSTPVVAGSSTVEVVKVEGSTTTPVAGSLALTNGGTRLVFTPAQDLPADADIRVRVSGSRAVEGGAHLAAQTWTFHTRRAGVPAEQSLFTTQQPAVESSSDASPVELGAVLRPAKNGKITAIRFFKGTGNGGTHTGSLWSMSGQRLARVTFDDETASGWQTAYLTDPLRVLAGTSYVVSYHAPQGHYAVSSGFFAEDWVNGDLSAPAGENGRYLYGAGDAMPTFSYDASNYFVDVLFERDVEPLAVTGRSPAAGAASVAVEKNPSISFSAGLVPGAATMRVRTGGSDVAGSTSLSGDGRTLTFDPSAPLPYGADVTVTVEGISSVEGTTLPTQTWTFRTEAAAQTVTSLLTGVVPQTAATNDGTRVEVGMAFTSAVPGTVTGVRFYKGTGNGGTHTGSLWNAAGQRLATGTFTGETATGWQQLTFATPVAITPGQTYVVSYYAPQGRYATTPGFFTTERTVGPLTAIRPNGRYRYGNGGGFPTNDWNNTNYFVDVVFRSAAP